MEIQFNEDMSAIIQTFGKSVLEESIKSTLVNQLNIDDWRIRKLENTIDSYVIFEFLPPNEAIEQNALSSFESQLEILENIIKNGGLSVIFNDGKILTINSSHYSASIKLTSAENPDKRTFNLWFILAGVIIGTAILVGAAYYFVKYKLR